MAKFVTAEEAVSHIKDNMTLVVGGFSTYASPEELINGLAARYEAAQSPKNLFMVSGITPGDKTESMEPLKGYNYGLNKLRADGLIGGVMFGLADARAFAYKMQANEIAGYLAPMGIIVNLFRSIAGGAPGLLTKVGLGTFCDPRIEGCAVNEMARQRGSIVELMEIHGEEYLLYKSFKPDVCFIRGTYADEDGNISVEHEGLIGAELEMAAATHNKGGIVIVQVEEIVRRGSIHPRTVRIHGKLVDYVVKATNPDNHRQCSITPKYRPELVGDLRTVAATMEPMELSERKVIARRAAMELRSGIIINLGVGMPSGLGPVCAEEGITDSATMSIESGPMGGTVQDGLAFPGVANAEAIFSQPDITNMYDGGLLDMTFLGGAEIDAKGNVNTSKFAGRCSGPGGFINISQNTKKVFFMFVFTAGKPKPKYEISDDGIKILQDGNELKFVEKVQQITFSGEQAVKTGQEVMFITERCVFRLTPEGLLLTELAPGVDLQKDVLDKMAFKPLISPELKPMDPRLFRKEPMGLSVE